MTRRPLLLPARIERDAALRKYIQRLADDLADLVDRRARSAHPKRRDYEKAIGLIEQLLAALQSIDIVRLAFAQATTDREATEALEAQLRHIEEEIGADHRDAFLLGTNAELMQSALLGLRFTLWKGVRFYAPRRGAPPKTIEAYIEMELPRFSGRFNIWGLSPALVLGMLSFEVDR